MDNKKLMDITLPVARVIPFSNVEGKGNRTSIFLQGCNLNCLYCHNPEMIPMPEKNTKPTDLEKLLKIVKNSVPFIRGVTVSGGEPTLYDKELIYFFKELKKLNLTSYIDTNGFFDVNNKSVLIEETDKFLFDIKGRGSLMRELCFDRNNKNAVVKDSYKDIKLDDKEYSNLETLKFLLEKDKIEEVRLVYIKDFYDAYAIVEDVAGILKPYPKVIFKIIRVHLKGARDPKSLAKYLPTKEDVNDLANFAREKNIQNINVINI